MSVRLPYVHQTFLNAPRRYVDDLGVGDEVRIGERLYVRGLSEGVYVSVVRGLAGTLGVRVTPPEWQRMVTEELRGNQATAASLRAVAAVLRARKLADGGYPPSMQLET